MLLYMYMFNRPTHILLDDEYRSHLAAMARLENTSIGELVRRAIRKVYFQDEIKKKRAKAIDDIMRIRPHFKGKIDYKELINSGRER